jgi:uncharacterized protein (TIGR00725 family)
VDRTPRPFQVSIIGDSVAALSTCAAAEELGAFVAQHGMTLLTGGQGGVMEAAARGAAQAGGLTVGIIPSSEFDDANAWCRVVIPTGLGHARNVLTALAGDAIVVLGGGAGTLSEIAFGWIHGRPLLTLAGHDGWADRLGDLPVDPRPGCLIRCRSVRELGNRLLELVRPDPEQDP